METAEETKNGELKSEKNGSNTLGHKIIYCNFTSEECV
jgi:hypothetical protein